MLSRIKQLHNTPYSLGLSVTSQQYFSLGINQPPAKRKNQQQKKEQITGSYQAGTAFAWSMTHEKTTHLAGEWLVTIHLSLVSFRFYKTAELIAKTT
jgi:hypothetical protein